MSAETLLRVWFGADLDDPAQVAEHSRLWFSIDEAFDAGLRERFGDLPDRARSGALDSWVEAPRSALALVLALDQLPRNLYRDTARSFAYDAQAVAVACAAIDRGYEKALHPIEVSFLYMPFEHAEDAALQARGVELYGVLLEGAPVACRDLLQSSLDYAVRHRVVIDRFGRFPHRNAVLGRASTDEERRYLESGGENFSRPGADG